MPSSQSAEQFPHKPRTAEGEQTLASPELDTLLTREKRFLDAPVGFPSGLCSAKGHAGVANTESKAVLARSHQLCCEELPGIQSLSPAQVLTPANPGSYQVLLGINLCKMKAWFRNQGTPVQETAQSSHPGGTQAVPLLPRLSLLGLEPLPSSRIQQVLLGSLHTPSITPGFLPSASPGFPWQSLRPLIP